MEQYDVERVLRTGEFWPRRQGVPRCQRCDCPLEEEYYDVWGILLCPDCLAAFRRWQ